MVGRRTRVPYQEAARQLLRGSVFDATADLLSTRDWNDVTMTDVAEAAGVSRQTLYNEFKSRQGLVQAYALRLTDQFLDEVEKAINENVHRPTEAVQAAFAAFMIAGSRSPLVVSLLTGQAKPDLIRLVTVDGAAILERASVRLKQIFMDGWVGLSEHHAALFSTSVVRLAISFITLPPDPARDTAAELGELLGPFIALALEDATAGG